MPKDNTWIFRRLIEVDCNTGGPHGKRCSGVPAYYCCWICRYLDECARRWKKARPHSVSSCSSCRRKPKHWCSGALDAWLMEKRR